jgi:hypothetical protein
VSARAQRSRPHKLRKAPAIEHGYLRVNVE